MKNKGAIELTFTTIVLAVLALIILSFLIYFAYTKIGGGVNQLGKLSPNQDALCLKSTESSKLLGTTPADIDGDGRGDNCDWCVCKSGVTGCHNDDDDKDGDKMPTKCDNNDNPAKGGKADFSFKSNVCNQASRNLYDLGSGNWQCYIS